MLLKWHPDVYYPSLVYFKIRKKIMEEFEYRRKNHGLFFCLKPTLVASSTIKSLRWTSCGWGFLPKCLPACPCPPPPFVFPFTPNELRLPDSDEDGAVSTEDCFGFWLWPICGARWEAPADLQYTEGLISQKLRKRFLVKSDDEFRKKCLEEP